MPGAAPPPLPPPLQGRALLAVVKARYVGAIREELESLSGGCLNLAVLAFILAQALTVVLLPRAVRMFRAWRARRALVPYLREALRFAEAAEPVLAYALMVNRVLRKPGEKSACGLFLISFDPQLADSFDRMAELTVLVGSGTSPSLSASDRAFCEALMDDEEYVPFRRRRIPASITGERVAYAVDVALDPKLLVRQHISDDMPIVPCMAEPGDEGRLLQMPYWFFDRDKSTDRAEHAAFIEMVTSLEALRELGVTQLAKRRTELDRTRSHGTSP